MHDILYRLTKILSFYNYEDYVNAEMLNIETLYIQNHNARINI